MPDQQQPDNNKPNRNLSDISHLFLSNLREKQQGGAPRPQRIPPASQQKAQPAAQSQQNPSQPASAPSQRDISIDLTPEEYASVFGDADGQPRAPHVTAIIGAHLNGKQIDRIKEYARHLAAQVGRVGLIELDAAEFRLVCFDRDATAAAQVNARPTEEYDARQMAEAIEELNWDVERWLLVLPNPRTVEAKALLREADHWLLLSTCDHDGVVSCYRTLKGLADMHRPHLSLALLDATSETESVRVSRKLSSVCEQFLNWPLEAESVVLPAPEVSEHLLLCCRSTRNKAQMATAPQWQIVADFLARAKAVAGAEARESDAISAENDAFHDDDAVEIESAPELVADFIVPTRMAPEASAESNDVEHLEPRIYPVAGAPELKIAPEQPMRPTMPMRDEDSTNDVIDLPGGVVDATSVIGAVLSHAGASLIECPVRAPMCPDARLAITRDRGLVMLAVAKEGLSDLRTIGQAYRWLIENRPLITMALPQFSINAHALPSLRLLVDHADLSAETLSPMLESGTVTVQAYRQLRWGQKTGLLLEAA